MMKYSPIIRGWRSTRCLQSCTVISTSRGKSYSTFAEASEKPEEIIIPQRIHRGPTDILQALAGTIGRDPTAPHYKYHDDPFLIPTSNYKKRVYAMAQESGRKAAHWIRQEHKEYFMLTVSDPPLKLKTPYKNADPPIQAFVPKPTYNDSIEVCEEDLKTCLRNSLVSDAKKVFSLLEAKDPDSISQESRQQFLELLCFFNDQDPIADEWVEERWFRQGKWMGTERHIVVWKGQGLAQSIFTSIKNKTPESYCAIIQGMCKYYQAEKAYQLYQECLENKIKLNTDVYNGLLSVVGFLKEPSDLRWQMILDLLQDMKSQGLKPNIGTLNATLESISSMNSPNSKGYCMRVLAEFNTNCGVQPSIGTWYHVLCIFCKERGPRSDILYSIMDQLDGKDLKIQDPKDVFFFVTAMNVCRYHVMDINLGKRVHALLLHGSNYNLIGDSYKESIYYRHYFSLYCRFEPLESFIDFYHDLVPNVYVPEPSVMKEVLRTVDANAACEHYPLLWSHMVMFGHGTLPMLIEFLLESMLRNLPPSAVEGQVQTTDEKKEITPVEKPATETEVKTLGLALSLGLGSVRSHYGEEFKPPVLAETFANIAWDIWNQMESQPAEKTNRQGWTGSMLGNMVGLLVQAKRLNDAQLVVKKLSKDGGVSGIPSSPQPLLDYAHLAITQKQPGLASPALSYLLECGFSQASEGALNVLEVLLNKPRTEIEEYANQSAVKDMSAWSADPNIASLLAIVNQKNIPKDGYKDESESKDSSDSSDSSSDSDSSDDELELPEIKK